MNKNVSIIIPAYNSSKYIEEAVDSCIIQLKNNDEIVIVDDGSIDETVAVLKKYSNFDNVKYIYQKNGGPASARNTGMKCATGAYISFLDSDDTLLDGSIDARRTFLDSHSEVSFVFSDHYLKRTVEDFTRKHSDVLLLEKLKKFIVSGNKNDIIVSTNGIAHVYLSNPCFHFNTVMMRRDCLERCGYFNEDLLCAEDTEMMLRLLMSTKFFGYLDFPTSNYNYFRNGISTNPERAILQHINFFLHIYNMHGLNKKYIHERIASKYVDLSRHYLIEKDLKKSISVLLSSFKYRKLNFEAYKMLVKAFLSLVEKPGNFKRSKPL